MPKHLTARKIGDQYVLVSQDRQDHSARFLWIAGGGLLALWGLRRAGIMGTTMLAVGGGMIFRGIVGGCPCGRKASGPPGETGHTPSHQHDQAPSRQLPADSVEEASMESFPASDAPG